MGPSCNTYLLAKLCAQQPHGGQFVPQMGTWISFYICGNSPFPVNVWRWQAQGCAKTPKYWLVHIDKQTVTITEKSIPICVENSIRLSKRHDRSKLSDFSINELTKHVETWDLEIDTTIRLIEITFKYGLKLNLESENTFGWLHT